MTQPVFQAETQPNASARERILDAAKSLITESGVEAATTRAVAEAAGVQAPTIYRLFGDKDGLLDAVAEAALAAYVADKIDRPRHADPVEELREGWDRHVDFALDHPGLFAVMTARPEVPRESPAMQQGLALLREKIQALAASGRLRMPEDRALELFHGTATGIILTLLRQTPADRDLSLSPIARDAAISMIVGQMVPGAGDGAPGAANALRTHLPTINGLSAGEKLLLSELLDRVAAIP